MPHSSRFACTAIATALIVGAWPAAAERRVSLAEAIRIAWEENPSLKLEQAKVAEAEATRRSTRGLYGPKLLAEGNVLVWNKEQPFKIEVPDELPPSLQAFAPVLQNFDQLFDFGNIRDQVTSQATVTLAQPLTPLGQIHHGYIATKRLAEAARLDRDSKRVELAYLVSEAYLQLMQTTEFTAVAKTGVEQVEAHLRRAQDFFTAGLIGKQEVLKAQLELARARERLIRARYGASLASSALALQLGWPAEERVIPTEKVEDPPRPMPEAFAQCLRQALRTRPDLKAMEKKQAAAAAGRRRAFWELVPQISAVATYQHTIGQGNFYPENAFFAGGVLKWELWNWGNTYYAAKAASAKARQAELGRRLLDEGIQLQTKKAYLDLKESEEALGVARVAISEAAENYRIERQRFEANANTSTDVLDAQLALTRAQLSYTTSLYGYYIARAALLRAMGRV